MSDDIQKSILAVKQLKDDIQKSFTQTGTATQGLQAYNLSPELLSLYPVKTPLRDRIARQVSGYGSQANWKAMTSINAEDTDVGVLEGRRNAAKGHAMTDYYAAYRTLGIEDSVTDEAQLAGAGFVDLISQAQLTNLRALMIGEEKTILGGNSTIALGTTPTPTLVSNTTGGTIAQTIAMRVYCVALTEKAYGRLAGFNNGATGQALDLTTATVQATVSRTSITGATDTVKGGVAQKSAVATVTTATDGLSTHSISATVTPVNGAVAYAWYWGTVGIELLGAITTINSVLITTQVPTGTQNISALPSADNSMDALVYDGMLSQIMKSGSGAYVYNMPTGTAGTGTKLTSNGAAGVTQIDNALISFYDKYRLSPSTIYVGSQQFLDITALVLTGGGVFRLNNDAASGDNVRANRRAVQYLNPITGDVLNIEIHPNMPAGTIMFWSDSVPYPTSNTGTLVKMQLRRDYFVELFPRSERQFEYGVYVDGVLQCLFPPAFGVINNIAAGH